MSNVVIKEQVTKEEEEAAATAAATADVVSPWSNARFSSHAPEPEPLFIPSFLFLQVTKVFIIWIKRVKKERKTFHFELIDWTIRSLLTKWRARAGPAEYSTKTRS